MNKPLQRELFAQRPIRSDFARRRGGGDSGGGLRFNPRKLLFLAVLVVVAILIGVGINMLSDGDKGELEVLPTIHAEYPIKERPDQPGGIDIPHQDVTVFEKLDGKTENNGRPNVEHLLPVPEVPKAAPTVAEAESVPSAQQSAFVSESAVTQTTEASKVPAYEEMPPAVTAAAESVTPSEPLEPARVVDSSESSTKAKAVKSAVTTDKKKIARPVKTQTVKTVEKKVISKVSSQESRKAEVAMAKLPKELFTNDNFVPTASSPSAPAKEVAVSGKSASVQLASVSDESAAQKEAARYQAKYAGILGGATLRVVRVDLASKGVFYRIISNPVSQTKAKAICSDITKLKKGSCLVVK
ncbi:MAG: SPOR domain-containing protein [Alphaproteobacteria bacterium]|nr:SPOR domain-containing protein [Alphaproteobacteria bacterium]